MSADKLLKINHMDADVQRRGRVLAILILGILASTLVLIALNLVRGQSEYHLSNAIFFAFVCGIFLLNRSGYVLFTTFLIVLLTGVASFFLIDLDTLMNTYIVMCVPVFIASFLIRPWSGLVVAALAILATVAFVETGLNYLSLLSLMSVSLIAYLLARSLDRAHRQNNYRAFHDPLTGLPNRSLLMDRLRQSIARSRRDGSMCAVLFMDLDSFKIINDSLGHEPGDDLLVEVADRISSCVRPGDTAARLGGDEFTVLLAGVDDVSDAVRVADRIADELRAPLKIGGQELVISTSVGIALSDSFEATPSTMLRNADMAMYEAKREGKARFKVFNSGMYAQALTRLRLENDLRLGVEREELRVCYQPKISLETGEVAGMEALVRWEHPERGLISPGEFISVAEETGLIIPLGQWMLRAACRQAREWQEQFPAASSLVMSVNLSVRQFQQPDLVQTLERILRETDLEPGCLQLEITESVVARNARHAVELLGRLKALGVQIAIDDFGTGYSSLNSFKRFPLDELKIDKTFVEGLGHSEEDTAIVQMVTDLAHAVNVRAVAEGVETVGQSALLRDMQCDMAQGYYFSKPVPAGQAAELFSHAPSHWLTASEYGSEAR